jgi:hypothetical protein
MSAPIIYKGTNITHRGTRYHWKRGRGWDADDEWHGSPAAMLQKIRELSLVGNVDEIFYEPRGDGAFRVAVNYSTDGSSPISSTVEPPINSWELIGQDQLKDLKFHPNSVALGVGLVDGIAIMVTELQKITDVTKHQDQYDKFRGTIQDVANVYSVSAAMALDLFDCLLLGHTHFQSPVFVLRHTKSVTKRFTGKVSFKNISLKLYPCDAGAGGDSTLLRNELATAGTPLSSEVFLDLKEIEAPTPRSGYQFGWVKKSPDSRPAPYGKYEIIQEYWLDQWRYPFMYGTAST